MPYSIQTKDGIRINNIPDDVAPDSQQLKDRVAQIRSGQQTPQPQEQAAPEERLTRRGLRSERQLQPSEDIYQGLPQEVISNIESRFPMPEGERVRGGAKTGVMSERRKAAELEQIRLSNPALAEVIEGVGDITLRPLGLDTGIELGEGLASFLVGSGRGLTTVGRGVGAVDPEGAIVTEGIEGLRTQRPGALTGGEVAGEAAPFLIPGTAATLPVRTGTRILASGAVGASEGGVIARGKGADAETVIKSAVLGGVLGGASSMVPSGPSRASGQADDVVQQVDDSLDSGPAIQLDQIDDSTIDEFFDDPGKYDDLQDAARREAFEKLDLKPTAAQVSRDPELFQKQVDIFRDAEKNNKVRRALVEQEKILTDRVNGEIDAIGGVASRADATPIDAVTNKALELDAEISGLYKAARESAPDAKNVRFSRTQKLLNANQPIDTRTDGTVSAIRDEMRRLGFLDEAGNPTRKTSVEASENLRIFANSLYDGANPLARGFLRDVKDAIDDDVFAASGQDIFKAARKAKSDFMRGLESVKNNKFDKRQASLVKDVLEGAQQPDDLIQKAISRGSKYKAKELKEFRNYLFSGTPEQIATGARAWNDLRAAALTEIKNKAFVGPTTELGTQSLSRAGFKSALDRIGPQKMQILFSQAEREFLRDLARVANLKEPVAGVRPSPSAPAIKKAEDEIRRAIPALREWIPNISQILTDRADEKTVLNVVDQAEKIARQNQRRFAERMRRATVAPALLPAGAPVLAEDNNE